MVIGMCFTHMNEKVVNGVAEQIDENQFAKILTLTGETNALSCVYLPFLSCRLVY